MTLADAIRLALAKRARRAKLLTGKTEAMMGPMEGPSVKVSLSPETRRSLIQALGSVRAARDAVTDEDQAPFLQDAIDRLRAIVEAAGEETEDGQAPEG